ncbi:MAG: hypothetical protein LBG89_00610 [Rickettsiales bacterium]|jgi:hypothetical protein|nr:hypothetical protein [Rickettsiales bacterium]
MTINKVFIGSGLFSAALLTFVVAAVHQSCTAKTDAAGQGDKIREIHAQQNLANSK